MRFRARHYITGDLVDVVCAGDRIGSIAAPTGDSPEAVAGWLSFDPTNDLRVSDSHITLASGRDYGDVTPVKGITLGGGDQAVEVEVWVRALEQ